MEVARCAKLLVIVCLFVQMLGCNSLAPHLHTGRKLHKDSKTTFRTEESQVNWAELRKALASSTAQPIRVKWVFDFKQGWLTPKQKAALQNNYIPETTAIFQHFIKVRVPAKGPIKFSSNSYCRFEDATLSGAGVAGADIVMHVTEGNPKDPNECTATTFASARGCDWHPITMRPTVGEITVCPNLFSQTDGEVGATITHEVLHALGFDSSWFVWYYNQDGGKPYDLVAETRQQGGKKLSYMTTPRLTAYAREYFGCSSLPGAPFEIKDNGEHWPNEFIPRDLMVSGTIESGQSSKMTNFTLLLLEDSGWYVTNTAAAEELEVGRGQGCDFALGDCKKYLQANPANNNFCPASWEDASVCTTDYRGIGYCKTGASGCLIPSYSKETSEVLLCTNPNTFNAAADKTFRSTIKALGGVLSPNSRCVVADATSGKAALPCSKDGKTCVPSTRAALCVETRCNAKGQVVLVFKGQKEILCQKRGGIIDLAKELPGAFSSGTVYCPLPEAVCPTTSCGATGCGPNADCWQGSCKCHLGYAGSPCKALLKPTGVTVQAG